MLKNYWPTLTQVTKCMHPVAEETAEHLLLAVHEPMRLSHRSKEEIDGEQKTEHELLNNLLTQPYPIPILGPAGTGKSHLGCWLEAKLRVNKDCNDWHIIRIPKAASLRQILELLLDDLKDSSLQETRAKIKKIGEGLKVDQVANRLISDIKLALDDLFEKEGAQLQKQQEDDHSSITKDQISRIGVLRRHAGYKGLDALIGDSTFKQRLIGEGKCLYRIAKRFTDGKKRKEEDEEKVAMITLDDLGMNQPDYLKFSEAAQDYIRDVQLAGQEGQLEVVNLLNELLNDALHKTALNLYQVEGFTDLFTEIRRYLKQKNRTLVLLIEDLAAISAIKDELLDNLLVNSMYKGQEELCSIRSVFAVTTDAEGYKAYAGRRDTILSRLGNKEWHIEDSSSDELDTLWRIENLCGRYLNAARIGTDDLKHSYGMASEKSEWPPIWSSPDADDVALVKTFGESPNGHALFPFNKHAIQAMAYAYCYQSGKLQFVPRDIIIHILKNMLEYREKFIDGKFPSKKLLEALPNNRGIGAVNISTGVMRGLKAELDPPEEMKALIAIWGYQSSDLQELAGALPPQVARVFGQEPLAEILSNVVPGMAPAPDPPVPTRGRLVPLPGSKESLPEESNQLKKIQTDVDSWFSDGFIEQRDAKLIRKVLAKELVSVWKQDYRSWVSVKDLPASFEKTPPIYVAFNQNQPITPILHFGYLPKSGFKSGHYGDDPTIYKTFLIALKRHEEHGSWSYSGGFDDYCIYQNFIDWWVVSSIKILVENVRAAAHNAIKEHLQNSLIFHPGLKGFEEKLRFLCHAQEPIPDPNKKFFPPPGINSLVVKTPSEEWNRKVSSIAELWDTNKRRVLDVFTPGLPYAIEGDLLKPILRRAIDPEMPFAKDVSRLAKTAQTQLKSDYKEFDLLQGCTTEEVFRGTLTDLSDLLVGISDAGVYNKVETLTAKKAKNRIDVILKADSWGTTKALLRLLGPFEVKSIVTNLSNIDEEKAKNVRDILRLWKSQYDHAGSVLRKQNMASGNSDTATEKLGVQDHLDDIESKLTNLEAFNDE